VTTHYISESLTLAFLHSEFLTKGQSDALGCPTERLAIDLKMEQTLTRVELGAYHLLKAPGFNFHSPLESSLIVTPSPLE
jgi:hypothetical protein